MRETIYLFLRFKVYWKIQVIYYALINLTFKRHHILNISSKNNNWTFGFIDTRDRITFACFALLVDFIENEHQDDFWAYNSGIEGLKVKSEIDLLYNWWKYERPNRVWSPSNTEAFDKEDSNNLLRLIAVREYLWT